MPGRIWPFVETVEQRNHYRTLSYECNHENSFQDSALNHGILKILLVTMSGILGRGIPGFCVGSWNSRDSTYVTPLIILGGITGILIFSAELRPWNSRNSICFSKSNYGNTRLGFSAESWNSRDS